MSTQYVTPPPPAKRAFSLVELSIVLVILGLLVGGVLSGRSLIRAAELRSVSTQYFGYVTAVKSFHDKYFSLPGDMTNAQAFWGVAHATPLTCLTTVSTDQKTCNGDGNNMIDYSAGSDEKFRFWQHLANAGLIEGFYIGAADGASPEAATARNSPTGKLSNSLWAALCSASAPWAAFSVDYGHCFTLGGKQTNDAANTPIMKAEDIYNIDMKLDDGRPARGKIIVSAYNGLSTCTDTVGDDDTNLNANYLLSSSVVACHIMFPNAF